MRLKKWSWVLRTVAFLLVFAALFFTVGSVFGLKQYATFLHARGLMNEKRGSLDGVYIGASNVHCFWQPLFGWSEYGIAVYNHAFDALPAGAVRYLIEAARIRQPDALYIVNLNQFRNEENSKTENLVVKLHRCLDYMPVSLERARIISGLARDFDLSLSEQLELHFPIIAFHSRWNELGSWAFGVKTVDYKVSRKQNGFLSGLMDISEKFTCIDKRMPARKAELTALEDLMDYIDRSGARILFVKAPQVMGEGRQSYLNTLEDRVRERGFDCLDLLEDFEQTGIDLHWDFFNITHTNVHGSLKFSRALGKYLVERYGFSDKRGTPGWESWDEAEERYVEATNAYLLPIERECTLDKRVEAPALGKAAVKDGDVTVSWSASGEADGYRIYRKGGKDGNQWRLAGETDAQTLSWRDCGLAPAKYTYTVTACRRSGDELTFGSFDINGVSVTVKGDKKTDEVPPEEPENANESIGEDDE